ncbi:tetratricopeptide repeat protein [Solitalea sp. MAHUQ-68]|uniref:Tetratricopeptide repeat protein n=1 Tax=Solitalea agri TaxID=2953739 RepID=A0A9X2EZH1_9SPHI|nr:tetratricopeptide repeat protein [Solitalea agri]MCO4291899.1 tetratricopeptide repeat protein [Solitalea agri]
MIRLSASFLLMTFLAQFAWAQSDSTIDSLKAALKHTESDPTKINITTELSEELYKTNPQQALVYAHELELLALKINSDSLLNYAYINQATAFLHMGNYSQSLQLYLKAIQRAQKSGDSFALFSAYEKLGILYHYQNNDRKALQYFFSALSQFSKKKVTNKRLIERRGYLLKNIGIAYTGIKNYQKSAYYFDQALTLAREQNNYELMANVISNQGTLLSDQGRKDLALKQYFSALAIRKAHNNKWGLATSYLDIGQFYFNQKDYVNAEVYLKEAVTLGKQVEFWPSVNTSSSYLYRLYKQNGDYKNALQTFELNKEVTDTLYSRERIKKMQQLEMQYEFDRKQTELKTQQRKKELHYWLGTVTLILLLTGVFLLYLLQRNKIKKMKLMRRHLQLETMHLESDLEAKDKELVLNMKNLADQKEMINDVSNKLLAIKKDLNNTSQKTVQKIVHELQANLQPELLDEFEIRFQGIHEDFYKKLNEKFDDLTPNERKLCALLKLNMTSKEIATITHQSAKSIDVARTRLRKKLNLTGTDLNLTDFLIQLDNHKQNLL